MPRTGRIRDRVNIGAGATSELSAQLRRGVEDMPDGAGGFPVGMHSPNQVPLKRVLRIGSGRGANTSGSVKGTPNISSRGYPQKAPSARRASRRG